MEYVSQCLLIHALANALPQQVCMTNMNNIAVNEFNCTQGDILCYCEKINYGYGVRDCANEACASPADAAAVIAYGTNYCGGTSLAPITIFPH